MGILTPEDLDKLSKNPNLPDIEEADNALGYKHVEPELAICCVCKRPNAAFASHEPIAGYRWGGWFCGGCMIQGQILAHEGFIVDQFTKEIKPSYNHPINRIVFDRDGNAHNLSINIGKPK